MSRGLQISLWIAKAVVPLVTVALSGGAAWYLYDTKPQPAQQAAVEVAPAVSAAKVERRTVCFPVRSQGTVSPRTESTLVAPVTGRIVSVAESFDESGFFRKGDVLVQIDRRDFQVRIQRLKAAIQSAQAEQRVAKQNLDRQVSLQKRGATSQADLDHAQAAMDQAIARIAELEAQLAEATNSEVDTAVFAPFDGCIRQKQANVGQYVMIGTPLATCFATDSVEVRLPVDHQDFGLLGLPLGATLAPGQGPAVTIEALFAGRHCRWEGAIVRSEAMIDARSRMAYLVASVTRPYEPLAANGGQPLAVGMFVEATIRSLPAPDAVVLPEACVSHAGDLFVIDQEARLQRREVSVLRREKDWVVVRGELADGQRVCATRLEFPVSGMKVEIVEDVTPDFSISQGEPLDLCTVRELAVGKPNAQAKKE